MSGVSLLVLMMTFIVISPYSLHQTEIIYVDAITFRCSPCHVWQLPYEIVRVLMIKHYAI